MSGLSGSFLFYGLRYAYSGFARAETTRGLTSVAALRDDALARSTRRQADEIRLSGLGRLALAAQSFESEMTSLAARDGIAAPRASSANRAVAQGHGSPAARSPASYAIVIDTLARAEAAQSTSFATAGSTTIGSGTITIETGNYNPSGNVFVLAGHPPVLVPITNGTPNSIAADINAMKTAVRASVVQDASGYRLKITGANGGTAQVFRISIDDGDGTDTDMAGLSRLAYDPTGVAGAGKNLTQTDAARNAAFAVDGTWHTRAENVVKIADGLLLLLRRSGPVTISVAREFDDVESAAERFVSAYNDLAAVAKDEPGERQARALLADLKRGIETATEGALSIGTLNALGITEDVDDMLALDRTRLKRAFETDQTDVATFLSRLARRFEVLARDYIHFDVGEITRAQGAERVDQTVLDAGERGFNLPNLTPNQSRVARAYALTGDLMRGLSRPSPGTALSLVS